MRQEKSKPTPVEISSSAISNSTPSISVKSNESNAKSSCQSNKEIREPIFKIVCNNIDNWRDMGRCFGMVEAELNQIWQDQEIRNDMRLLTNRIMERMEERYGDQFYKKLIIALEEARRKDIIRQLKKHQLI